MTRATPPHQTGRQGRGKRRGTTDTVAREPASLYGVEQGPDPEVGNGEGQGVGGIRTRLLTQGQESPDDERDLSFVGLTVTGDGALDPRRSILGDGDAGSGEA